MLCVELLRTYDVEGHDHVAALFRAGFLEAQALEDMLLVVHGAWLEDDAPHALEGLDLHGAAEDGLGD